MTELKDMKKHAKHLEGQIAAENEYFKEIIKDILALEAHITHEGEVKKAEDDVHDAIKIMRKSLGRTERQVERRDHKRFEEDVEELRKYLPKLLKDKLESMIPKMEVLLNDLVKVASRNSAFADLLKEIENNVKSLEDQYDVSKARNILAEAKALIDMAKQEEENIAGLEGLIEEYEKFLEELMAL